MIEPSEYALRQIGVVRSPLHTREGATLQGSEGAPEVWMEIDPTFATGLAGIVEGDEIVLLTWLHRSRRDVLAVHPRGDRSQPLAGVFATRSPDRPNPIGLHRVRVLENDAPT